MDEVAAIVLDTGLLTAVVVILAEVLVEHVAREDEVGSDEDRMRGGDRRLARSAPPLDPGVVGAQVGALRSSGGLRALGEYRSQPLRARARSCDYLACSQRTLNLFWDARSSRNVPSMQAGLVEYFKPPTLISS